MLFPVVNFLKFLVNYIKLDSILCYTLLLLDITLDITRNHERLLFAHALLYLLLLVFSAVYGE